MNARTMQDSWDDMRMHVIEWWDRLTEDDLDAIDGNQEELISMLQDRYGYTRGFAESEVERHMAHFEAKDGYGNSPMSNRSNSDAGQRSPQSGDMLPGMSEDNPSNQNQGNQGGVAKDKSGPSKSGNKNRTKKS